MFKHSNVILTINNVEIMLNKYFGIAFAQKLYANYLLDNNISKFDINIEIKSPDTYN